MRPLTRTPHRRWLRSGSWLGFALGISSLAYVAFTLIDAQAYQAYASWRMEKAIATERLSLPEPQPSGRSALTVRVERVPKLIPGSPLGRIQIRRLGLSVMVLEGVDGKTLRRGVGHIPGTALPGQYGNAALAGHRDTFFRGLRDIREGDNITLTTLTGTYNYRVESTKVVSPEETYVLQDSPEPLLTLVTCHPFDFIGSAPNRFIVRAHRQL
jgi:sortase A